MDLEEGVKSIGDYAFYGCTNLVGIDLPESLTSIGSYAFLSCPGITSVTVPAGVKTVQSGAFSECSALKEVTLEAGVTAIRDSAFKDCPGLEKLTLPGSLTAIGSEAFSGCASLADIVLPDGLTSIDRYAFGGCENLTAVAIPGGVKNVSDGAFSGCAALKQASLAEGITAIGSSAFQDCASLENIALPSGVTSVGEKAFLGCESLAEAMLPGSLTSLGQYAFGGCEDLTAVSIPGGVKSVSDGAFSGCPALKQASLAEGITAIGSSAFLDCASLENITLPLGVSSVGEKAFLGCVRLERAAMPGSVKTIGDSAFGNCVSLWEAPLPGGITQVGNRAFFGCKSLPVAVIPASATSVGSGAFVDCTGMDNASFLGRNTSIGSAALPSNVRIYGYAGSTAQRYAEVNGNPFVDLTGWTIDVSDGGATITGGGSGDSSLMIPDQVESYPVRGIAPGAFAGLKITAVSIGRNVTAIGLNAFSRCSKLTTVYIPRNVASIGAGAFIGGSKNLTIYGAPNSAAEVYAKKNKIAFAALDPAAPSGLAVTAGSAGYTLSWNPVRNVKGYIVYESGEGGAWVERQRTGSAYCGFLSSGSVLLSDRYAVACYWEIPGLNMTVCGPLEIFGAAVYLAPVAAQAPEAVSGGRVELSWPSDGIADGYRVYRKAEGCSWTLIQSTAALFCTDSSIEADGTYQYGVQAFKVLGGKTYTSDYLAHAATVTVRFPLQAPVLGADQDDGGIRLSWTNSPGAQAYRVFRRLAGADSWSALGDVTGTVFTDTSFTAFSTYEYAVQAVRAVDAPLTSDYSNIVTRKALGKYDMSQAFWGYDASGSFVPYAAPFVYDGSEKAVTVGGLPEGVAATGYSGNAATEPGAYRASAALQYDAENYLAPACKVLSWRIEVPVDGIEAVFDQGGTVLYTSGASRDPEGHIAPRDEGDPYKGLKALLKVYGRKGGSAAGEIADYALTGPLEAGTQRFTVEYAGYTDAFDAKITGAALTGIEAEFIQGGSFVYTSGALDDLRPMLTVTAKYADGSTSPVTQYALQGPLTEGACTVTATYEGQSAEFQVNVSDVLPDHMETVPGGGMIACEGMRAEDILAQCEVRLVYNDGSSRKISQYQATSQDLSAGAGRKIAVSAEGMQCELTVDVALFVPVSRVDVEYPGWAPDCGEPFTIGAKAVSSGKRPPSFGGIVWSALKPEGDDLAIDPSSVRISGNRITVTEGGNLYLVATVPNGGERYGLDFSAVCEAISVNPDVVGELGASVTRVAVEKGKAVTLPALSGYSGKWSVGDESVAQITGKGKLAGRQLMGLRAGSGTKLYFTVSGASSKAMPIQGKVMKSRDEPYTVADIAVRSKNQLITSVQLSGPDVSKSALTVALDAQTKLTAKLGNLSNVPEADRQVFWKSSNETVVTVDESGSLKAVGTGKAVIAATSTSLKSASVTVTVVDKATGVSVQGAPSKNTLYIGDPDAPEPCALSAVLKPAGIETMETLTWESSRPAVASVENGMVTALSPGKTTITVKTSGGKKATLDLTVKAAPVKSIAIPEEDRTISLTAGDTYAFPVEAIEVLPAYAGNRDVKFSISKKQQSYATVTSDGVIKARKPTGSKGVVVTVTAKDGTGVKATFTVTVKPKSVQKDAVPQDEEKITLKKGKAYQIPTEEGTEYIFKTSNAKIATVDLSGRVKAKKKGTAIITVEDANGAVLKTFKVVVK